MNVQLSAINRLRDLGLLLDQPRTGGLRVRHRIVAEHMIEFLRVQGQLAGIVEALGRFAATIADIRYRQNRGVPPLQEPHAQRARKADT